jgi:hypothetical protein
MRRGERGHLDGKEELEEANGVVAVVDGRQQQTPAILGLLQRARHRERDACADGVRRGV